MTVIRAHFDGRVIIPDEPVELTPDSKVMVLIDGDASEAMTTLQDATRQYYQQQSTAERAEDAAWGNAAAADSGTAWE